VSTSPAFALEAALLQQGAQIGAEAASGVATVRDRSWARPTGQGVTAPVAQRDGACSETPWGGANLEAAIVSQAPRPALDAVSARSLGEGRRPALRVSCERAGASRR